MKGRIVELEKRWNYVQKEKETKPWGHQTEIDQFLLDGVPVNPLETPQLIAGLSQNTLFFHC